MDTNITKTTPVNMPQAKTTYKGRVVGRDGKSLDLMKIYDFENEQRFATPSSHNIAYLWVDRGGKEDGKIFLRAYEWSAYLISQCSGDDIPEDRRFKPCRIMDSKGVVYPVSAGGPESSFPTHLGSNWQKLEDGDGNTCISYILTKMPEGMATLSKIEIDSILNQWKETIEPKKIDFAKDGSGSTSKGKKVSAETIVSRIENFPLEAKNPVEVMLFLAELKKEIRGDK